MISNMKNQFKKLSTFNFQFSTPRGFTLVETLLAVTIIAVLGTILLSNFNPLEQIKKSNDAKRKASLNQLQRALESYYSDYGKYPASSPDYKLYINATTLNWGSRWSPYMDTLPADPMASRTYIYYSPLSSNGQTYYLYANLELGFKDPQACLKGNACSSVTSGAAGFPTATACGGTCSFGLSSPNVSP